MENWIIWLQNLLPFTTPDDSMIFDNEFSRKQLSYRLLANYIMKENISANPQMLLSFLVQRHFTYIAIEFFLW